MTASSSGGYIMAKSHASSSPSLHGFSTKGRSKKSIEQHGLMKAGLLSATLILVLTGWIASFSAFDDFCVTLEE